MPNAVLRIRLDLLKVGYNHAVVNFVNHGALNLDWFSRIWNGRNRVFFTAFSAGFRSSSGPSVAVAFL